MHTSVSSLASHGCGDIVCVSRRLCGMAWSVPPCRLVKDESTRELEQIVASTSVFVDDPPVSLHPRK
jgi:hypothetical protein